MGKVMHKPDDTIVIRKSSACGPTSLSFEAFSDDLLGQIAGAFQYRYRRGAGRSTVERRRTWRERLFSWPWRPWVAWTEVAGEYDRVTLLDPLTGGELATMPRAHGRGAFGHASGCPPEGTM